MAKCSFKLKYWNFDLEREIEFECPNKKQVNSDKCIFHDKHFLDSVNNREIVHKRFQKKINDYLSKMNNEPFYCIGYNLCEINIEDKEFHNPVYFNHARVSGSFFISNCKFLSHVSFFNSQFLGKGDVNIGGEFSGEGDVVFSYTNFSNDGNVSFESAEFLGKGDVDFTNAQFLGKGDVDFTNAQFSKVGDVSFPRANFSREGKVLFSYANFSNEGDIDFNSAQFSGKDDVDFSDAQFSGKGNVSFNGAEFQKDGVFFARAKFTGKGGVSFIAAQFLGKDKVVFNDANFSNVVYLSFKGAQFSGEMLVSFFGTHFSSEERVDFSGAKFSGKGDVDFSGAKFLKEGDIKFSDSQFSGNGSVNFSRVLLSGKGDVAFSANFLKDGDISFSYTEFSKEGYVLFSNALFSGKGDVDFSFARFSPKSSVFFAEAIFSKIGNVLFNGVIFFGVTNFIDCRFECKVFFVNVIFQSPNEVKFETEDLSNVSFLSTDITRIVFHENAHFGKLPSKKKEKESNKVRFKKLSERFRIFDERRFEECIDSITISQLIKKLRKNGLHLVGVLARYRKLNDKKDHSTISNLKGKRLSLGSVLASYRNLRENFEYRLRYDEAGQFFVREMEVKRKYRDKFSFNQKQDIPKKNNWFRRNFSFIGLYHLICNYGESSTRPLISFVIIMGLSTAYWSITSSSGFPLEKGLLTSSCNEALLLCSIERTFSDIVGFPEKGIFVDYIIRIVSIIVLATLFLPFRRKFERRFRH